jgi:hypothetical protein
MTDEVSVRHPHSHRRALTPDQAADLAAELDEQEFEERVEPICVAPVADGSRSLSEAAHELHAFAVWLVEMEIDGWQMVHEAEDGHLHVVHSDPSMRLYDAELHEA